MRHKTWTGNPEYLIYMKIDGYFDLERTLGIVKTRLDGTYEAIMVNRDSESYGNHQTLGAFDCIEEAKAKVESICEYL